ncbi:MAG: BolA family protein [Polyangiaceae bacterium]
MSRKESIQTSLERELHPVHLEVINESHMHSVPKGAETHFKVVVASDVFAGLSRVERHRRVHAVLRDELARGLHALTISSFSVEEWASSPTVASSPECLGGSRKDAG